MSSEPNGTGGEMLRVLIKANNKVTPNLLEGTKGLAALIGERYGNTIQIAFTEEPSPGIQVLQQQIVGLTELPTALNEQGLDSAFVRHQFDSSLISGKYDVIVLSIEPELFLPLWQHKTEGWVFAPPAGYTHTWNPSQQTWLQETCQPLGLPTPPTYQENLNTLVQTIRTHTNSHILLINASSLIPEDTRFRYQADTQSLALRINQLNLALLNVSSQEGISIIDVDRLIAELGHEHVTAPLTYSTQANSAIRNELLRVLVDLGYFENDTSAFKLTMPYIDRSIRHGRIVQWHKAAGDTISAGDDIADIEVEIIKMARTKSSMFLSRGKSSKTGGRIEQSLMRLTAINEGVLREVYARPGQTLPIDTLLASLTPNDTTPFTHKPEDLATATNFRVTANKIDRG